MSKKKYDLAVAYRIYPKVSAHKPPVFADDKYKLAELCVNSFRRSLGDLKVKIWVLLDNCPPEYETLFSRLWADEDTVFVRFSGVGDAATFHEQARILIEQIDSEIVYLAEDDYFYLPDQMKQAVSFLKNQEDVGFISPYDHPDIYSTSLHKISTEIREFSGKNWRSCMSTTHTFLTTRTVLRNCGSVFLASYGKISPDLSKWMAVTKHRVFNPFLFVWWGFTKPFWAASIFFAWRFCWRQILFGRRWSLWVPQPSIANHMAAGMEAPGVDWKSEFEKQAR